MTLYNITLYKDRTQESTEGDENDGGSEVDPGDLYGDGLGTEGDGEEFERGSDSEVDPGDFEGDSLGISYLKVNLV